MNSSRNLNSSNKNTSSETNTPAPYAREKKPFILLPNLYTHIRLYELCVCSSRIVSKPNPNPNLLSNAIKYTPEKGTIQLELISVKVANTEGIHLRVKDSGIGIKESQLPQIFNRFYQVDDSSTRHQEGTGIGLTVI